MVLEIFIFFSLISVVFSPFVDFLLMYSLSLCLFSFTFWGGEILESFLWLDSLSAPLLSLSSLLPILSLIALSSGQGVKAVVLISMVVMEFYFMSKSILLFFMSFEISLIPMFFIILGFGVSSERVSASKYIIVYTLVASAPLFCVVVSVYGKGGSLFSLDSMESSLNLLIPALAFLVKAPMFLAHSWLPRAHVEAPLEGSMLLAGVMLKMGIYGLVRVMMILPPSSSGGEVSNLIFSISIFGSVVCLFLSISSDDMKTSVAYSSISHMNLALSSTITMGEASLHGVVITMIAHGFTSSLMFFVVTLPYSVTHSRSVLINKGFLCSFQQVKAYLLLVWAMNLSIPPLVSFLGELKMFGGILSYDPSCWIFILSFMCSGSLFSMLNFGILSHSSETPPSSGCVGLLKFTLLSSYSFWVLVALFFHVYPSSMDSYALLRMSSAKTGSETDFPYYSLLSSWPPS